MESSIDRQNEMEKADSFFSQHFPKEDDSDYELND